MALSDAYQASSEALLTDMAQRPQPRRPQAPSFSIWSTITAAPKGTAAGAAQGVASTSDVLGAFGSVLGAVGDAGSQGMFGGLTDEERKQSNTAREKLITAGPDYNSEAGRSFRNVAKDYMPDPTTAHAAEQAVANLFRVGSKAIVAATTLGNIPGAIVAGAEEGFTQADELGQQGVDLATRTKVGAVTALTNAVGFALPVAGKTWGGTFGLALAGGPASFVAQNAATREILQGANYSKLADQFDPFDPVGLALSTVLPLGFGALAMRGKGKASRFDDSAVEAARVDLLREQIDANRAAPPTDLVAAGQHTEAMNRAINQLADGGRVEVSDVAPAAARITEEVDGRLKTVARAFDEVAPAEKPPTKAAMEAQIVEAQTQAKADAEPAAKAPPPKEGAEFPELDRAAMDLEARVPDLQVQLDGMDAPMKVSELMARVREEAKAYASEAPLVEAAAQCFLRTLAG